MRHRLAWLCVAGCLAGWAGADEPRKGPKQIEVLPAPRVAFPALEELDDSPPPSQLTDLKEQLAKLRAERDALAKDHAQAAQFVEESVFVGSEETAKLRLRLGGLLTQLGTGKTAVRPRPFPIPNPKPPPDGKKETPPDPDKKDPPPEPDLSSKTKIVEPLALAQSLFRAGSYDAALKAYRMLPLKGLKAEERAPVQYMMATCLRKLGKTDEASAIYREVANSRGDEHLAACAQWQLAAIRWQRELEDQLKTIRQRRLELETPP